MPPVNGVNAQPGQYPNISGLDPHAQAYMRERVAQQMGLGAAELDYSGGFQAGKSLPLESAAKSSNAHFLKSGSAPEGAGGYIIDQNSGLGYHVTGTDAAGRHIPGHTVNNSMQIVAGTSTPPAILFKNEEALVQMLDLVPNGSGAFSRRGFSGQYSLQRETDGTFSVFYSGGSHQCGRPAPAQTFHHGVWDESRTSPAKSVSLPPPPRPAEPSTFARTKTGESTVGEGDKKSSAEQAQELAEARLKSRTLEKKLEEVTAALDQSLRLNAELRGSLAGAEGRDRENSDALRLSRESEAQKQKEIDRLTAQLEKSREEGQQRSDTERAQYETRLSGMSDEITKLQAALSESQNASRDEKESSETTFAQMRKEIEALQAQLASQTTTQATKEEASKAAEAEAAKSLAALNEKLAAAEKQRQNEKSEAAASLTAAQEQINDLTAQLAEKNRSQTMPSQTNPSETERKEHAQEERRQQLLAKKSALSKVLDETNKSGTADFDALSEKFKEQLPDSLPAKKRQEIARNFLNALLSIAAKEESGQFRNQAARDLELEGLTQGLAQQAGVSPSAFLRFFGYGGYKEIQSSVNSIYDHARIFMGRASVRSQSTRTIQDELRKIDAELQRDQKSS